MKTANGSGAAAILGSDGTLHTLENVGRGAIGAYQIDPLRDTRWASMIDNHARVSHYFRNSQSGS